MPSRARRCGLLPRHMVARPLPAPRSAPAPRRRRRHRGRALCARATPARASRPAGCSRRRRRRLLLSAATAAIGRPKRAGAQASAPPPEAAAEYDGIMPSGPPGPGELRGARGGSAGPRGGLVGLPCSAPARRGAGTGAAGGSSSVRAGSWPWASQGRARPSGGAEGLHPEARGWEGGTARGGWRALPKRGQAPADPGALRTTAALSRARRRKVPRRFWASGPAPSLGPRPPAGTRRCQAGLDREAAEQAKGKILKIHSGLGVCSREARKWLVFFSLYHLETCCIF